MTRSDAHPSDPIRVEARRSPLLMDFDDPIFRERWFTYPARTLERRLYSGQSDEATRPNPNGEDVISLCHSIVAGRILSGIDLCPPCSR